MTRWRYVIYKVKAWGWDHKVSGWVRCDGGTVNVMVCRCGFGIFCSYGLIWSDFVCPRKLATIRLPCHITINQSSIMSLTNPSSESSFSIMNHEPWWSTKIHHQQNLHKERIVSRALIIVRIICLVPPKQMANEGIAVWRLFLFAAAVHTALHRSHWGHSKDATYTNGQNVCSRHWQNDEILKAGKHHLTDIQGHPFKNVLSTSS